MLPPSEDWFFKANKEAVDALPDHLRLFVSTPEDSYRTVILPVVLGDAQWVLSAFCEQAGRGWPDDPRILYAPRVLIWIHHPSGAFRWEEPDPDAHGLATAVQDGFGLCLGPIRREHLEKNGWYNAITNHFSLILRVVEQRWLVTAYPTTQEERETARTLQQQVRILYDAPLLPFYRHYGRHFLGWMERAAK